MRYIVAFFERFSPLGRVVVVILFFVPFAIFGAYEYFQPQFYVNSRIYNVAPLLVIGYPIAAFAAILIDGKKHLQSKSNQEE